MRGWVCWAGGEGGSKVPGKALGARLCMCVAAGEPGWWQLLPSAMAPRWHRATASSAPSHRPRQHWKGHPWVGCCASLPAGAALWKLLGSLPPATKPTCQHVPRLDKAPTGDVTSSQYQLWGASTGSHQGSGWLSFSDVPLHGEGADDILLGSRRIGMYWELQDSRCSALVENSACCYIGAMMYQAPGTAPRSDIMVGHNSRSPASTCGLSGTSTG